MGALQVVGAEEHLRIIPLVSEKQMVVSLEIADAYTDDIREAVSSGLRTTFTYDVELRMLVAGWVDRTIATSVVSISVQYDNLTRRHSLSRTVDGRIDEAVVTEDEEVVAKWLTSVERLPLCSTAKLERNRDYYVRVNARKRPQRTFPFPGPARPAARPSSRSSRKRFCRRIGTAGGAVCGGNDPRISRLTGFRGAEELGRPAAKPRPASRKGVRMKAASRMALILAPLLTRTGRFAAGVPEFRCSRAAAYPESVANCVEQFRVF